MNRPEFKFKEFANSIVLIIKTKSPEKWLLIDRETGESYQGNKDGHWDKLKPIFKDSGEVNHNG
jgi:hypothetical protein